MINYQSNGNIIKPASIYTFPLVLEHRVRSRLSKDISDYDSFEKIFTEALDKHTLIKRKFLRANNAPYMIETLRKAIMCRSQLETKYFKTNTQENLHLFKKQRNF